MKCDRIVGEGTCNNEPADPSGLCFAHRGMPGETLRELRAHLKAAEYALGVEHARAKHYRTALETIRDMRANRAVRAEAAAALRFKGY